MIESQEISEILDRYYVFDNGNISDSTTGKLVARVLARNGYEYVHLYYKGKAKMYSVHRLVGIVYVPGYVPALDINHIDGNKRNNSAINLEWVTRSKNIKHAYDTNLRKSLKGVPKDSLGKEIIQLDSSGKHIASFKSISEARRTTGITNISKVLSGERVLSGGFMWKYKEAI